MTVITITFAVVNIKLVLYFSTVGRLDWHPGNGISSYLFLHFFLLTELCIHFVGKTVFSFLELLQQHVLFKQGDLPAGRNCPKMVSSWWSGKQCKHIPPIQGNGKRQQGTVGKRFPTLRLSSLFLSFLYLLRLPHGLVLVSFSGLTLSQHILGRPPGAFFRVSSTAGQRQIYPVYFWSCQLAHLVHTAV